MVEVHNDPPRALSDGAQALTIAEYEKLVVEVRAIREVISAKEEHASHRR
jgi:3-deoxy-D-arabino-heptulosonate 7-phosphate (DAHP) synthase